MKTHCPYCALQCGMHVSSSGTVTPRDDVPANAGGHLCVKGWTAGELLRTPDRLTRPLIRTPRGHRPASWDAALDHITREIRRIQAEYGRDGMAVYGGGGLTNEKAYLLGKFARVVLRTSQIDYNGRFCMSSAAAASNRAFGVDRGLPFPITDIADARAILLAGGNLAETMPPFMRHVEAARSRGGVLIVIDPRQTPTARVADLHLKITPGTDLALAQGMLHIAIAENRIDREYIASRTVGFAKVVTSANAYWPERVEQITGVPAYQLRAAVRLLTRKPAMILTARGAEQHTQGTDTVTAFINLALALGLPGRPSSGFGCVTGQGNGQGGREHGQKADQLPGYRRIDDPAARRHVAKVWGVAAEDLPGPGPTAYELLDSLGTGPRGLLILGSNPVVSAPHAAHITERLRALELLVVSDFVLSETAALADVVLPSTQWAEETGTMTNLEGRVLLRRQAVDPPAGVHSDLRILADLAERLGVQLESGPREVFRELGRASAGGIADYSDITYERIEAETGVFWGNPRMFLDGFPTPGGRARFTPVEHRGPAEDIDEDYPLYLITGRVLEHYQSGAQTRRAPSLAEAAPEPYVELHPILAERLAVQPGTPLRVTTRRGTTVAPARVSPAIRADTVFMPFHWPGANLLTNPALDPLSGMPEFKVCAARVEPAT